jgi:hypothetical protein
MHTSFKPRGKQFSTSLLSECKREGIPFLSHLVASRCGGWCNEGQWGYARVTPDMLVTILYLDDDDDHVIGVRLLRTSATSGYIIHPPDDIWS